MLSSFLIALSLILILTSIVVLLERCICKTPLYSYVQDLLGTSSDYHLNEAWERLLVGNGSEAGRLLGCDPERLDRERFRHVVADRIPPNIEQPGRLCAPTPTRPSFQIRTIVQRLLSPLNLH